jgi:hypothetical protein
MRGAAGLFALFLLAQCAGVSPVLSAESNVTVFDLKQTDGALQETYQHKGMVLPRMVMLDGKGRVIYGGPGLPSDLRQRLHKALRDDVPIDSTITLEAIVNETRKSDGGPIEASELPPADAYIIDYWAVWCSPCHILSRDLNSILRGWNDKHFVWLRIESDPKKLRDKK